MNLNANQNVTQIRKLDRFSIYHDSNQKFLLVDEMNGDISSFVSLQEAIVATVKRFNQAINQKNYDFCRS